MKQAGEITFLCTADDRVGFGHLRRCIRLASLLADQGFRAAFADCFLDAAARDLLNQCLPGARLTKPFEPSSIAVVDCMFDPQEPEACDRKFVGQVAACHCRTVFVTSAIRVPNDLPVDAVVGHMLEPVDRPQYSLFRGLEWAPVPPEAAAWRDRTRDFPETPRRVLVAFGNWADPAGLFLALDALRLTRWPSAIRVLLPPALRPHLEAARARARGLPVEWLCGVPDLFPILAATDVLLGSYGNLTFESLALGVPTVLVAIKPFMHTYGERLAQWGAAVNAGEVGKLDPAALALWLQGLSAEQRGRLSKAGYTLVDGAGLERLASLLLSYAR